MTEPVSFLDVFVQMLGGGEAEPPPMELSLPTDDVIPIAGDSSTSTGLPQDDANVIMGDYRPMAPEPEPPSVYDTSEVDAIIRDLGLQAGTPAPPTMPGPGEPFVPGNISDSLRDADPIGGVPSPDVIPLDVELPGLPPAEEEPPTSPDVVPIAGDSSGESPPPPAPASSGVAESLDDVIAATAEDLAAGAQDTTGLFPFLVGVIRSNPLLAVAAMAILVLAIVLPLMLSGGGSSPASAREQPPTTTAPAPTTTASTPTTTAAAPATPAPAAAVSIASFSLLLPQGFQFSLAAPAGAPAHETVTLAFTGPGLPHTATVSVAAGHAVPLRYPTQGCGKWTVRVAAIDGKPVRSAGNPDLENGMTHAC